jgi:branched-subunit amino acid transport protein AzlD
MDFGYLMLVFIAMAAVTFAERALPFAASKWLQKQRWVRDLGDFLPLAIMVLLTVHVARDAAPTPEVVSIAFAFVLQWFLKNPLVSIFAGTALYVAWVNGYLPF